MEIAISCVREEGELNIWCLISISRSSSAVVVRLERVLSFGINLHLAFGGGPLEGRHGLWEKQIHRQTDDRLQTKHRLLARALAIELRLLFSLQRKKRYCACK
jgi:hypothetical protein